LKSASFGLKPDHPDIVREALNVGVAILRRFVVSLALHSDALLRAGQFKVNSQTADFELAVSKLRQLPMDGQPRLSALLRKCNIDKQLSPENDFGNRRAHIG